MRTISKELEKVMEAALAAGVLDIRAILKDIRSVKSEQGDKIIVDVSSSDLDCIKTLMQGDIFRSEEELLQVMQISGLILMKFAIDHPDDFDLELFFSESLDNMEMEGRS